MQEDSDYKDPEAETNSPLTPPSGPPPSYTSVTSAQAPPLPPRHRSEDLSSPSDSSPLYGNVEQPPVPPRKPSEPKPPTPSSQQGPPLPPRQR